MAGVPVRGVSELVLEVVDIDAAEAFYAGILGLGRRSLGGQWSHLAELVS
jgi:hypothetical protein